MRVRRRLFAVAMMLVATACSSTSDTAELGDTSTARATALDAGAVRQAIESSNAAWLEAVKRGDTLIVMSNYADDAIVMMPNEEAWRGRDGVRKGFAGFLSQLSVKEASLNTQDVMVGGDLAVETGTYEWTLQPKAGGSEIKDKGKYMAVWKRTSDGSWKIVRDINNSDLPPTK